MTIAAGFLYADGVMLCADSQMTVGSSKLDGMKVGRFDASWGQVASTFAGNVDFAAAAFQQCERECESADVTDLPVVGLAEVLEDFYRRHVFEHPQFESGEYDYSLLLAIRLNGESHAKLYRAEQTIFREIKSFDCIGSGEDYGREIVSLLHDPNLTRSRAVALAAYMLGHVKKHAQYCGGKSVILALQHTGQLDPLETTEVTELANHMENVAAWFVWQAQQFILGHTFGDEAAFERRLEILGTRAKHARYLWESRPEAQSDPQHAQRIPIEMPPWPV